VLGGMYRMKTVEAGASTTVWAAVSADLEEKGGLYLENCAVGKEINDKDELTRTMSGYMSFATSKEGADRLWEISENLINKK